MHVVIAVDGSPTSVAAARAACPLLPPDAEIHLVTVVPPRIDPMETSTGFAGSTITAEQAEQQFTADVVEGDAVLAETARALGPSPYHQRVLASSQPADEICRFAGELPADLVVVGTSGRGLTKLVLGSVSQRVLDRCPAPVLVVPATAV